MEQSTSEQGGAVGRRCGWGGLLLEQAGAAEHGQGAADEKQEAPAPEGEEDEGNAEDAVRELE